MNATPGQTIGPFFGHALPYAGGPDLVPADHPEAVRLHGRVLDGAGAPVPDALLELWQDDGHGHVVQQAGSLHRDPAVFTGWGRAETDADGAFAFTTVRPGLSFFAVTIFARGLLDRLFTRAYLPGADDPFLRGLDPQRRETLMLRADDAGWVFDIRLQGDRETVFLRYPRH